MSNRVSAFTVFTSRCGHSFEIVLASNGYRRGSTDRSSARLTLKLVIRRFDPIACPVFLLVASVLRNKMMKQKITTKN